MSWVYVIPNVISSYITSPNIF